MKTMVCDAKDIGGVREQIFDLIQRDRNDNITIYFEGWSGFGPAAVLRSIPQALSSMKAPPPKLCFGRTIYIDCSKWTSMRVMQRQIVNELKLDRRTIAMFEAQDEEDDFNGVDLKSRDAIRGVASLIEKSLRESRFMMIFINGSDEELDLRRIGITEYLDYVMIWTFSRTRFEMMFDRDIKDKLRYTDVYLCCTYRATGLVQSPLFIALFYEEAANIVTHHPCMAGMELTTVVDCCLYGLLFLYHSYRSTNKFVWPAHTHNYWICDGIIRGDKAWEISNALYQEISFKSQPFELDRIFSNLKEHQNIPFSVVEDRDNVYETLYYRWMSIRLKNKEVQEGMQPIFERASSIFLAFETKGSPCGLPNGIFKQCNNLAVLVLSCCSFSFSSPPFLHCKTLRLLGLDHCIDDSTIEFKEGGCTGTTMWAFLKSIWVIDLYYTDWVEILSEEKIELMANLMELNIEGVRLPRWTSSHQLQKRLPNLKRLRIIRAMYDEAAEAASSDIGNSFLMNNSSLELLDLSCSNRVIGRNLAASVSKASNLQALILDGCDGLEDVVLPNNSSLKSFRFDGYGPASAHRTTIFELPPKMSLPRQPPADEDKSKDNRFARLPASRVSCSKKKSVVRTSIISLAGSTRLDNLFLRGLPNLVELDLSGCAIKVLDFEAMVVDVPRLKRLFLLGCERLCAIKWGTNKQNSSTLEMLCIDTRPGSGKVLGCAQRPKFQGAQQKSFGLLVHVNTTDARLSRSLCALIDQYAPVELSFIKLPATLEESLEWLSRYYLDTYYFNIRITSSAACGSITRIAVPPAATGSKETMIGSSSDQRQHCSVAVAGGLLMYDDVFIKVGDGRAPTQAFPQATMEESDSHIEIGDGCHSVQSETEAIPDITNLSSLMTIYAKSVHVHDVSTCSSIMPASYWFKLRWCRIERFPNLHAVFPPGGADESGTLETVWASDLLTARCVWSKGTLSGNNCFKSLMHLHLCGCPSLRYALAMGNRPSFPSLETIHIIYCGDLRHVFVPANEAIQHTSVQFPKLRTIQLQDLPALQQICEAAEMVAPALEAIRIRGCWSLRRLPSLKGRDPSMRRRPTVEVEKDVWDALCWDGVAAEHHPSLYEAPVHSRYYKIRRMLRGTVLR